MKKFIVLYMMPIDALDHMMANTTPEEKKQGMEAWGAWMQKYAAHFADMGAPAGKNTRVTKEGTTEVRNDIMGYSIMQAESKEELLGALREANHLTMPGAYIEVMDWVQMS
jgi:hypothetical protein